MGLRDALTDALKTAMRAGDGARVSTLRMVAAKVKDADIAARPAGPVDEAALISLLRSMVKSRRESIALYVQGNRPELAAKEQAEIAVIEGFLPTQMDDAATRAAITAAVADAGATGLKDMGKVMALLRERHAASLDLAAAGPLVKASLGG